MSKFNFRGLGVALVTPFTVNGDEVDYACLEFLANRLVAEGADYIVVMGTTAETPTLSVEEKCKIRTTVRNTVGGRVPLVIGIGGNCTRSVCEELRHLDVEGGYDAVLSVTPYYNKPSQTGLYHHFAAIANASPIPVILYNVPGRTGVNMLPETTLNLARDFENIIAIKEASGNLTQIKEIIDNAPAGFHVISGDDAHTAAIINMGGEGVISVIANAFTKQWQTLTRLAMNGQRQEAMDLQEQWQPMIDMLFAQGNPAGIKTLMSVMDLCSGSLRLPLTPVSDSLRKEIEEYVNAM